MAAIAIRGRAKATGLTNLASLRAKVSGVVRRVVAFAAAAVMVAAVGAALFQLVAQMLSFPTPVAVIGISVLAAGLLNSLRTHLRTGRVAVTPGIPVVPGGSPGSERSPL